MSLLRVTVGDEWDDGHGKYSCSFIKLSPGVTGNMAEAAFKRQWSKYKLGGSWEEYGDHCIPEEAAGLLLADGFTSFYHEEENQFDVGQAEDLILWLIQREYPECKRGGMYELDAGGYGLFD